MLRRSFWAAPALLALAGSALARPKPRPKAPPPPPPPAPSLIGAWSLISAETLGENGEASLAFGDRASGLLIYDRSGEMSLQIAGDRPMVGSIEAYQALNPEDRMIYLDGYYAYFGSFEIDEAAHVVIHRVRQSLRPTETGESYRRQYVLDGDRLTLASAPEAHAGQQIRTRLVFSRA